MDEISWDALEPTTIQKCFSNCGFGDTVTKEAEKDEEVVPESELEELVHSAGTTRQDYANCDQDLATTNNIEGN